MIDDTKDDTAIVQNKSGKLKLVVDDTDAILVIDNNMIIKMVIPQVPDGESVPDNTVLISAIATRLNLDPTFSVELIKFLENYGKIDEYGITNVMGDYPGKMDTTGSDDIVWN